MFFRHRVGRRAVEDVVDLGRDDFLRGNGILNRGFEVGQLHQGIVGRGRSSRALFRLRGSLGQLEGVDAIGEVEDEAVGRVVLVGQGADKLELAQLNGLLEEEEPFPPPFGPDLDGDLGGACDVGVGSGEVEEEEVEILLGWERRQQPAPQQTVQPGTGWAGEKKKGRPLTMDRVPTSLM